MAQEDELALASALLEARRTAPDEEAQVRSLARALEAPVSAIRNTPAAQRPRPSVADISREILAGAPETGRFLTNPDNARIAQDDVRPMSEMERILARSQFAGQTVQPGRQPANTPLNWLRGIGSAFGDAFSPRGTVAEGAQLALFDLLRNSPFGQPDATGSSIFNDAARQGQMRDVRRAQAGQEAVRPDIEGNVASGIYGGLTSLTRSAPGVIASLLTANPIPAMALAGTQTSGEAYGRYAERGATPGQAALGAAGEGAVEVATELLPMGFLVDAFGAAGGKRFLVDTAKSLLTDVPGEQLATLAQDAIDTAIANPDKTWADYAAERPDAIIQTLVATLTQGALTTGATALARTATRRMTEAEAAETDANGIAAMETTAASSALRERSPETFEAFVGALAQDGPVENLYVDAQAFVQALGEEGVAAAIEAVPAVRDQLADALANGGDIQIPVEQFAARLAGTDLAQPLLDHLRANPILPSRAEVQALAQDGTENLVAEAQAVITAEQTDQAFQASAERVQESLLGQLNTAGRFSRDVNTAYASLITNFYAVQAARLGLTPEQMAERYPLRVTSEAPGTRPGEATMDQRAPRAPSLQSAVRVDGRVYTGATHMDALAQVPDERGARQRAALDGNNRGYVTERGRFLNRFKAQDYARDFGLFREDAPSWVASATELASEYLRPPVAEREDGTTLNQSEVRPHPAFYSALTRAVAKSQTKRASADQWKATLAKTAGVKKDEIEWSGVNEWLDAQDGQVAREDLLAFLENGGVKVEEVVLGEGVYSSPFTDEEVDDLAEQILAEDPTIPYALAESQARDQLDEQYGTSFEDAQREGASDAQFSQYKLPGADDTYREILLTLPNIDGPSTHWDEPNVIAHTRITARTDATGAKVLFLEEVQSDWHQKGRDEGYETESDPDAEATARAELEAVEADLQAAFDSLLPQAEAIINARLDFLEKALDEGREGPGVRGYERLHEQYSEHLNGVDPTSSPEARSRAVRAAFSRAETMPNPPDDQARAYADLIRPLQLRRSEAGMALDNATSKFGIPDAPFRTSWAQLVMKRMIAYAVDNGFDKIAWINGNQQNGGQTGGDGSFFYERNLVNSTNDLLKKMGGRVEKIDFRPVDDLDQVPFGVENAGGQERPSQALGIQNGFTITDQMKAQAADGFALFQRNRGQIAFTADITQTPSVITLLQTADLSTFLHETGHFFLEVQAHMARQADAPAEVAADMQALLDWFGVPDLATWDALPIEEKRPLHEQFARGFEAYLFEGNAPSSDLRALFQRFRSWLLNVYRSLSALNVTLTDEVRSVMGRMLASAEAVKETEDARHLKPLFETKPDYMTDAAWEEYQRSLAAATEDGMDTLQTRTARDMQWLSNAKSRALKRLQRANDEARKAVRAEVTAEVMAEPVNRVRRFLTRGIGDDGEPIEGAGKLDLEALRKMYGDGEAAMWRRLRVGGKFGEAGNNGLDPDAVAEMFGFESGDQMVRTMVESEPAQQKIASETDQRMFERYGDVNDERSLERAANQAVANDARARFVATEMAALAQMTGRPRALAETARTVAAGIVNRLEIKRLRPAQFFAAQARAARAAERALAKDDLQTAATQKRNQLVNLQAARYVLAAQDEVEKSLRLFNRIINAKDEALTRTRDMNLVNAARAILAAYGVGRVKNDPISYLEMLSRYDPVLYADLKPWIDGARVDAKPIDQLTFERFQGLRDTVNQLWTLARRTRQMEVDGQLQDLEQLREALGARLDEIGLPDDPPGPRRAPTDTEKFQRQLQGARAALRRVESWARGIDGADTGPFRRIVWNPVSEGADRYRTAQREYLQRFLDLMRPIEASLTPAKIAAPEIGYTFSGRAELLHAILHTGNSSNLSKLLLGRSWGRKNADGSLDTSRWDALRDRLIAEGVLTQADYDFAQSVWDLLDETKPGAQAAHRAMYGRYFDEVAADPVATPWGQYRGGYVPALTDAFLVQDAALRAEQEAIESGGAAMFPAASNGFTKSRVEDYTRELALDLRLLPMHIDKVLKFTHLGPPVRDVARLLKGRAFSAKLQAFDPVAQTDLLLPWLERAAKQIVETPSRGAGGKLADRFFSTLRSRTGMQLMFANVSNALQQVTGFSSLMVRVKPANVAAAFWRYIRAPGETAEAVASLSPFMASRTSSQMFEVRQTVEQMLLNPSKYDKLRDFAARHGYFLQTHAQNLVDTVGWAAAYDQAVARGDTEREAIRFADSVIRETQGTLSPEDVSSFETGTPFVRLFTQFYSFFNMQSNLLGTEFQQVARGVGVKKGAGRLLYVYTMGFLIPALGAELIATAFRGGFDDEDEDGYLDELFQWFFIGQVKFAAAGVPVVGQATNAAIGSFTGVPYDDKVSVSPAVSSIDSSVRVPAEVYQSIVEGESFNRRDVRDTLTFLGLLTRLPLGWAGRPIGYGVGVAQGDIEPTSTADAARGFLTGAPSPESRTTN